MKGFINVRQKTAAIHSILCHHWTGLVPYLKRLSTCKKVLEYNFSCEIERIYDSDHVGL